ncbi:MAG TPA: HlyD family efflux transporter periplasmic adaptor subunit [Clostridiales bacterium]|nr:HlyD family efflux transporter periplasmic adaptor subunit [Clostridiales bacterium]
MRITIRKSIIIAIAMMIMLVIAVMILTLMRIDRKVIIPGAFTYRNISPVVIEESGFAAEISSRENSEITAGDVIMTLANTDLDMEITDSENRITLYKLELEEILQLKELDVSLSSYDLTKLKEELKVKKDEEKYYREVQNDKEDLYAKKIISKDEYEGANIALKQKELEVKSIQIQLNELNKQLQKLDASSYLNYKFKQKELEIEENKLTYLKKRSEGLIVRAKMDGRLVADKMENRLNEYFSKGDKIGDVVSYDRIDFIGYASGSDIVRIKEGQDVYFNVDTFRGKDFIHGKVKKTGLKSDSFNGEISFPVEIEVVSTEFFDRGRKRFIHAGVVGEAIIITEEDLPILRILWEQMVKYADIN